MTSATKLTATSASAISIRTKGTGLGHPKLKAIYLTDYPFKR